jgi:hypothetical protein
VELRYLAAQFSDFLEWYSAIYPQVFWQVRRDSGFSKSDGSGLPTQRVWLAKQPAFLSTAKQTHYSLLTLNSSDRQAHRRSLVIARLRVDVSAIAIFASINRHRHTQGGRQLTRYRLRA